MFLEGLEHSVSFVGSGWARRSASAMAQSECNSAGTHPGNLCVLGTAHATGLRTRGETPDTFILFTRRFAMRWLIEKRIEQSGLTLYLLGAVAHTHNGTWGAQCHKARRFDTKKEARDVAETLAYEEGENIRLREEEPRDQRGTIV